MFRNVYNIRIGTPEDFDCLLGFTRDFFNNSHYAKTDTFDPEVVGDVIRLYFSKPKTEAIILILEKNGIPVGFIAGLAFQSFMNRTYTAVEQLWWVDPNYRGRASFDLLKALEAWATKIGCSKLIITGQTNMVNLKPFLFRLGYGEKEYTFIKELN